MKVRLACRDGDLFDWSNWWALELDSRPNRDVKYSEQVLNVYRPLFDANIAVDFARPDADLSRYKLVIAPALYMVAPGVAENPERFAAQGGGNAPFLRPRQRLLRRHAA